MTIFDLISGTKWHSLTSTHYDKAALKKAHNPPTAPVDPNVEFVLVKYLVNFIFKAKYYKSQVYLKGL